MKVDELKKAILELAPEERLRLAQEVAPLLCESIMSDPDAMAGMMPGCREMLARHPDMMGWMRQMMSGWRGQEDRPR